MIKSIRTYYCDACGKKITGYTGAIAVIEFDDDGYPQSVGYDFCEDCMKSFVEWRKSRKGETQRTERAENGCGAMVSEF